MALVPVSAQHGDGPQTTLPPAQPQYILRGHQSQVHSVTFLRQNSRLLTGDADGWVILWNIATKRAVTVWRAHQGSILGLGEWGSTRIITHGRDSTLKVWEIKPAEEDTSGFSTVLPVDDPGIHRKEPWLLHSITVNTLTFCSFSFCREQLNVFHPTDGANNTPNRPHSIFVAVPAAEDSQVDIYRLPTERRLSTVQAPNVGKSAMVMSTRILFHHEHLILVAGYESGHTSIFDFDTDKHKWHQVYACQGHSQPVLSLDVAPRLDCFFTSSADDIVARHPLCVRGADVAGLKPDILHTKHAGQQSLRVRDDEKIFATAGWDSRIRVYAAGSLEELAVLKWHKEGCYAVAFAAVSMAPEQSSDVSREAFHVSADHMKDQAEEGALTRTTGATVPSRNARHRLEDKSRLTHWIAAGSKDGKVSLWDIY